MSRDDAWSPPGVVVQGVGPRNYGDIITVIGALTVDGLKAVMTVRGGFTKELFRADTSQVLNPDLRAGDVVIMDNLAAHKDHGVRALIESRGARIGLQPPYSPELNPSRWHGHGSSGGSGSLGLEPKKARATQSRSLSTSSSQRWLAGGSAHVAIPLNRTDLPSQKPQRAGPGALTFRLDSGPGTQRCIWGQYSSTGHRAAVGRHQHCQARPQRPRPSRPGPASGAADPTGGSCPDSRRPRGRRLFLKGTRMQPTCWCFPSLSNRPLLLGRHGTAPAGGEVAAHSPRVG